MSLLKEKETYEDFHRRLKKDIPSSAEFYSLDHTVACFLLPRIKALKWQFKDHPNWTKKLYEEDPTEENKLMYEKYRDFNQALNEMIFTFNWYSSDRRWDYDGLDEEWNKRVRAGLDAFAEWYETLWF